VKGYKKYEIRFTERIPEGEEPSKLDEDEEEREEHIPIVDVVRQDAKNMPDVYRRLRRGS